MSCYGELGVPIPCGGWEVYDSYVTDPRYAAYFSIGWASLLLLGTVFTLPSIAKTLKSNRWKEGGFAGFFGIYEDVTPGGYSKLVESVEMAPVETKYSTSTKSSTFLLSISALFKSFSLTTLPIPSFLSRIPYLTTTRTPSCHPTRPRLPFSLGTLLLVSVIPLLFLATLLPESQLKANPNRFGFLSLASIPPLFILSSKKGVVSYLTGKGWTSVNFLHRWLGRAVVLTVLLHMYFWTIQFVQTNQGGEFLRGDKEVRGLTALAFLLLIAFSSAGPVRKYSYPVFFVLHYVGIVGFLVFVNRHTIYARGWATWSVVAIYGVDIVGRLASMRVRYVEVEAMEGGMVRVGMTGVRGGWRAGQHVALRLFFIPPSRSIFSAFRLFESHPFSVSNAPPSVGILNASPTSSGLERGIELFIKSCGPGSWTGDLYETAQLGSLIARARSSDSTSSQGRKVLHMYALVEGPYGGLGYDAVEEENVLLVAGGSGMSFTLGALDEIVGRRKKSGRGGKIEVVWAVRERAHIDWFSDRLRTILEAVSSQSNLSIILRIYITCDSTLTEQSTTPTSPSFTPPPSTSILSLPCTQITYSRPQLSSILTETIALALAPCGNCYPVCRCGEGGGAGMCSNDEEECCGTGKPGNGRELLEVYNDEKAGKYREDLDEKKEGGSILEVEELPKIKNCCSSKATTLEIDPDEITELPPSSPSCCAPTPILGRSNLVQAAACGGGCCATTGSGCCSGGTEGVREKIEEGPLRIRTEGLAVLVCGPGEMIGELRHAVARVPLARQVRIGGIQFHAEHFSI